MSSWWWEGNWTYTAIRRVHFLHEVWSYSNHSTAPTASSCRRRPTLQAPSTVGWTSSSGGPSSSSACEGRSTAPTWFLLQSPWAQPLPLSSAGRATLASSDKFQPCCSVLDLEAFQLYASPSLRLAVLFAMASTLHGPHSEYRAIWEEAGRLVAQEPLLCICRWPIIWVFPALQESRLALIRDQSSVYSSKTRCSDRSIEAFTACLAIESPSLGLGL